jgi:hypothetical protein
MRLPRHSFILAGLSVAAIAAACSEPVGDGFQRTSPGGDDAGADSGRAETPPGGELADEQFPSDLLDPYTGPVLDEYDDTFVSYRQLRARVEAVFADTGLGGDTDAFFTAKLGLLGGADFKTRFDEARVASPDFLLGLDGIAKEACGRAATNKTGPFTGSTPEAVAAGTESALATQLFQKVLYRAPTGAEVTASVGLVQSLEPLSPSKTSAWAGLCEALVRHQDFVFTLPPSVDVATGADKERLELVKIATDFAGRPPTDGEFTALAGKTIAEKLEHYFATPEFRDFYLHRTRLRTESVGTAESDEAARLWTYLAVNGAPMQDLLAADYTVNEAFEKVPRPAEHGKTGILTMPGFIKTKPGLPHFNYSARVMSDYMGQIFEVTPDIVAARLNPATSTVQVGSTCINCHGVLTPLEHQRLRWADDGTYRTTDETGKTLDDTDGALVADYPYKGQGMAAFAVQAVKKERFFRQTFQSQFLFFMGRPMRYAQDERTVYLALWNSAYKNNGNFKELLKIVASTPTYLGH